MSRDPSLDELMWLIADEGDASTVESFGRRHPELRSELLHRVSMVRAMKGTRPAPATPAFAMREVVESPAPPNPWLVRLGFAAGLAGVAFASFWITRQVSPPPQVVIQQPAQVTQAAPQEAPPIVQPNPAPEPVIPAPQPSPANPPSQLWMRPVTIQSENTTLFAILNELQANLGLIVTIAPGLENSTVAATYTNVPAIEVLRDLGRRLGFTVFEQTDTEVLIIPAVPTDQPIQQVPLEAPQSEEGVSTPSVETP